MKIIKFILLPFALLYGSLVFIRNKLYDIGLLKSTEFDIPVISVGKKIGAEAPNLSVVFLALVSH